MLGRIEAGNTPGTKTAPRTKRGPRGQAQHSTKPLLYVLNLIAGSVSVVDTGLGRVLVELRMSDPTPKLVKKGRGFLYDAKLSGNGTMACAACHVDGRIDNLAWDPGGKMLSATGANRITHKVHPMKGPMTTQTLQGLKGFAPYHWRGDRPDLASFNPAFGSLPGKQKLPSTDMADFARFIDSITYGSNPKRKLDDSLPDKPFGMSAKEGLKLFTTVLFNRRDFGGNSCKNCRPLASGTRRFLNTTSVSGQIIKDVQIRNANKKTGRKLRALGRTSGFGLFNDGTKDDTLHLLSETNFPFLRNQPADKTRLMRFVEAFSTGTYPIVGYSRTVDAANIRDALVLADLTLLLAQADLANSDLVVHGSLDGRVQGFAYDRVSKKFEADRASAAALTLTELIGALQSRRGKLTFRGVPIGSGKRIGIDRDRDGIKDGDARLRSYGKSTPACATPRLTGNSSPEIGNGDFAFAVEGARGGAPGLLLIGTRSLSVPVFDMTLHVGVAGGLISTVVADSRGTAALLAPIPALASLQGKSVYAQAVMFLGCGSTGLEASGGLGATFVK